LEKKDFPRKTLVIIFLGVIIDKVVYFKLGGILL